MKLKTILFVLLLAVLAALAGFGTYRLVLDSNCVEERFVRYCTQVVKSTPATRYLLVELIIKQTKPSYRRLDQPE